MHNFKAIKPAQGYTLVELMITAAVIAMLAAIAIPSYNGYIDTTKHAATLSNAELLVPFVDNYYYENADGPILSSGFETNVKLSYHNFTLYVNLQREKSISKDKSMKCRKSTASLGFLIFAEPAYQSLHTAR